MEVRVRAGPDVIWPIHRPDVHCEGPAQTTIARRGSDMYNNGGPAQTNLARLGPDVYNGGPAQTVIARRGPVLYKGGPGQIRPRPLFCQTWSHMYHMPDVVLL